MDGARLITSATLNAADGRPAPSLAAETLEYIVEMLRLSPGPDAAPQSSLLGHSFTSIAAVALVSRQWALAVRSVRGRIVVRTSVRGIVEWCAEIAAGTAPADRVRWLTTPTPEVEDVGGGAAINGALAIVLGRLVHLRSLEFHLHHGESESVPTAALTRLPALYEVALKASGLEDFSERPRTARAMDALCALPSLRALHGVNRGPTSGLGGLPDASLESLVELRLTDIMAPDHLIVRLGHSLTRLRILDLRFHESDEVNATDLDSALAIVGMRLRALTLALPQDGCGVEAGSLKVVVTRCPRLRLLAVDHAHYLSLEDLRKLPKLAVLDVGTVDECEPYEFALHMVELMSLGRLRYFGMGDDSDWPQDARHSLNVCPRRFGSRSRWQRALRRYDISLEPDLSTTRGRSHWRDHDEARGQGVRADDAGDARMAAGAA